MGIKKADEQQKVEEAVKDVSADVRVDDNKAYLEELKAKLDAFPSYADWLAEEGNKNKLLKSDANLARSAYEVYRDLALISGSIFETPELSQVLDFLTYLNYSVKDKNISSYRDFKNSSEDTRNKILADYYHDASDLFDEDEIIADDEEEYDDSEFVFEGEESKQGTEASEPEKETTSAGVRGDIIGFTIKDNTNVFVITDKSIADTVVKSIIGK